MNSEDVQNTETILGAFKYAIEMVYNDSDGYFYPMIGRERSMVFRIAHHLANNIEKEDFFVDIEATRCNGRVKRISSNTIACPDLIVHKRGGKGYFVAEFKCSRNSERKSYDYAKLSIFTLKDKPKCLKNCCPTYEIGAFVYLGQSIKDISITLFENGEIMKGMKDVPLYEI